MERIDRLTLAAIAVAAMCIVTFDHEALGHGGVCLALRGHIELLTSVYFDCSVKTGGVAAGGPLGNLLVGSIAWLSLRMVPNGRAHLALLLLLVGASRRSGKRAICSRR
jgi:hypothetical protein